MKYIIDFEIPEDREEYERAVRASDAWGALNDVDTLCRNVLKHGHTYKSVEEFAQAVRFKVHGHGDLL